MRNLVRYSTCAIHYYIGDASSILGSWVCVDYLQKTATVVEGTLKAKTAFEQDSGTRGMTVQIYHADYGILKANGFATAVEKRGQVVYY